MIPLGMLTSLIPSGGGTVLLIGAAVLALSGTAAYVTHALQRGGASEAELAYAVQDAQASRQREAGLRNALEATQAVVATKTAEAQEWEKWADSQVAKIEALEQQVRAAETAGQDVAGPGMCPIGCTLPPELESILNASSPESQVKP